MKQRVIGALLVCGLLVSLAAVPAAAAYTDTQSHWAKTYVDYWSDQGVLSGYPDGTFLPNRNITRAEAAKIIAGTLHLAESTGTITFSDVPADAWYSGVVSACASAGIFNGYPNGTFLPNAEITRQEAMTILFRTTGLVDDEAALAAYTDAASVGAWAKSSVGALIQAGVITGYEDGSVQPQQNITRAEFATAMYRAETATGWSAGSRGGRYYQLRMTVRRADNAALSASDQSSKLLVSTTRVVGEVLPMVIRNEQTFQQIFGETLPEGFAQSAQTAYRQGPEATKAWLAESGITYDPALAEALSDTGATFGDLGPGQWQVQYASGAHTYTIFISVCNYVS